ncbi:hypothetical protein DFH06DRAFT_1326529 [Mycena polygramma]|nr:hypothetical protein DFH06DRAFT_1326529 [Mycena polygramma]
MPCPHTHPGHTAVAEPDPRPCVFADGFTSCSELLLVLPPSMTIPRPRSAKSHVDTDAQDALDDDDDSASTRPVRTAGNLRRCQSIDNRKPYEVLAGTSLPCHGFQSLSRVTNPHHSMHLARETPMSHNPLSYQPALTLGRLVRVRYAYSVSAPAWTWDRARRASSAVLLRASGARPLGWTDARAPYSETDPATITPAISVTHALSLLLGTPAIQTQTARPGAYSDPPSSNLHQRTRGIESCTPISPSARVCKRGAARGDSGIATSQYRPPWGKSRSRHIPSVCDIAFVSDYLAPFLCAHCVRVSLTRTFKRADAPCPRARATNRAQRYSQRTPINSRTRIRRGMHTPKFPIGPAGAGKSWAFRRNASQRFSRTYSNKSAR